MAELVALVEQTSQAGQKTNFLVVTCLLQARLSTHLCSTFRSKYTVPPMIESHPVVARHMILT